MCDLHILTSRHKTLNQCWLNVGPASRRCTNVEPTLIQGLVSDRYHHPRLRDGLTWRDVSRSPRQIEVFASQVILITARWHHWRRPHVQKTQDVDLMLGQRRRFDVGPASATLVQHQNDVACASRCLRGSLFTPLIWTGRKSNTMIIIYLQNPVFVFNV